MTFRNVILEPFGVDLDLYIQLGGGYFRLASWNIAAIKLKHAGLTEELHVLKNGLRVKVAL